MPTPDLETIYEDLILEHYNAPYHRGNLESATHTQTQRNPTCGDQVTLHLQIEDDTINAAHHHAKGCVITQAATSILCEHIEGNPTTEITNMSPQDMLNLMQIPLTTRRQQCALLPYIALIAILQNQQQGLSELMSVRS